MVNLVGARIERKEDKKFLTGRGNYTADINLARQTYACFVRSPHARAKITGIDTSKAKKASGVIDVLTGKELQDDKIGGLIAGWKIVSKDGTDMKCPAHPALATDLVNYVGDHVALVVAESLQEAKDAADLVKVDYKVLKAVASTAEAMNSDVIPWLLYVWVRSNLFAFTLAIFAMNSMPPKRALNINDTDFILIFLLFRAYLKSCPGRSLTNLIFTFFPILIFSFFIILNKSLVKLRFVMLLLVPIL